MELQELSRNYFKTLEDAVKKRDSTCFEGFLHRAQELFPYSVRNVGLILSQSPNAMKVHGLDEWKKRGASVKYGAKSIQIYAPTKKGGQGFCITNVIDISDTSAKYSSPPKESVDKVLLYTNTLAQKEFGFKLAYTDAFKPTYSKLTYLDWRNKIVYLKQGAKPLLLAWMALKDLILVYQQEQITKGKRALQGKEYANAIALASAFEVLDYLGCNPPLLPNKAKELILSEKNEKFVDKLKDVHKLASDMIRKIEALRGNKNK